jgi:hypothetical protein
MHMIGLSLTYLPAMRLISPEIGRNEEFTSKIPFISLKSSSH